MHNVLNHHGLLTYNVHYIKPSFKNVLCTQGKNFWKNKSRKWGENTKKLKNRVLSKTHILVQFFPDMLGLSPRELGQIFKSVSVGITVILEIYPSIPLGQGLSSFALQLEKQHAVVDLKY